MAILGEFPKGDERDPQFVYADPGNNPLPLSGFSGIVLRLYWEKDGTEFATFANPQGSARELIIDNASEGLFRIKLQQDLTQGVDSGWILAELKTAKSDASWNDGRVDEIIKLGRFLKFVDSSTETLDPTSV